METVLKEIGRVMRSVFNGLVMLSCVVLIPTGVVFAVDILFERETSLTLIRWIAALCLLVCFGVSPVFISLSTRLSTKH